MIYRTKLVAILAVLLGGVLAGCGAAKPDQFLQEAGQGGKAEVELGRLAAQHGGSPAIKSFGQQMVTDHSQANAELTQLAAKKNVTVPDPSSDQKAESDKLAKLSGADFDKEYVDVMVKNHENTIKLFQAEADKGTDPDVKAFAAKTLPVIQGHLKMIQDIKAKM